MKEMLSSGPKIFWKDTFLLWAVHAMLTANDNTKISISGSAVMLKIQSKQQFVSEGTVYFLTCVLRRFFTEN